MTGTSDDGSDKQILLDRADSLVREVGRSLIEHGLGDGTSLFDPARKAWSPQVVEELHRLYNEQPDTGADRFLVKLQRQLESASDEAILLAAELLTLHALPLTNFTEPKKRARIQEVLSWMREPVSVPAEFGAAFAQGSWSGGSGAHTMIWKWLSDAVSFVKTWWSVPESERTRALVDPWTWRDLVHRIPGMPSLREALLYLAFPGYFLPIISLGHKAAIRQAFRYRLKNPSGDLDHDLYEIMLSLQKEAGGPVELYEPPYITSGSRRPVRRVSSGPGWSGHGQAARLSLIAGSRTDSYRWRPPTSAISGPAQNSWRCGRLWKRAISTSTTRSESRWPTSITRSCPV
jgi:5-methylcytosine-specific restriction protein B